MFKFMTSLFSFLFLFVVQLKAMEGAELSYPKELPESSDCSCATSGESTPMTVDHFPGDVIPMTEDPSPVTSGPASRIYSPEIAVAFGKFRLLI